MNIVYKNPEGRMIPYTLDDTKITFGEDELTLNLAQHERDYPVHIDICMDVNQNITMGVVPGVAERYIAQIDIPARQYQSIPGEPDEEGNPAESLLTLPFDMDACTLTLWEAVTHNE